ncbi:MAG: hypothetical protein WDZ73_01455 [Candidatus Paceibacterota bacterium]
MADEYKDLTREEKKSNDAPTIVDDSCDMSSMWGCLVAMVALAVMIVGGCLAYFFDLYL